MLIMKQKNLIFEIILLFVVGVMLSSLVSAGVGIKWDRESALVESGESACLIYGAYNPWPKETWIEITVTEPLQEVLTLQKVESVLVPADTGVEQAIPLEFCFEVPRGIYNKDCWLGQWFVCEQTCLEEMKIYDGDVVLSSVPSPVDGGSAGIMAVQAPLRVKVDCKAFTRDYALLYVLIVVISAGFVGMILYRKYRTPPAERYKQQMKELRAKLKAEKTKK